MAENPKVKLKEQIQLALLPPIANLIVRLISLTTKKTYINSEEIFKYNKEDKRYLYCFWHDQIILAPYGYKGKKTHIMASKHKDGRLIGETMKWFKNVDYVLGSTTRGSLSGIKSMIKVVKNKNEDLALTPDGPKGPRHEAQMGAIGIARLTGVPIFPAAIMSKKKKLFNSWDRFMLPHLFNSAVFVYGEPIFVDKKSSEEEMEELRLKLEDRLNSLTKEAEDYFL